MKAMLNANFAAAILVYNEARVRVVNLQIARAYQIAPITYPVPIDRVSDADTMPADVVPSEQERSAACLSLLAAREPRLGRPVSLGI